MIPLNTHRRLLAHTYKSVWENILDGIPFPFFFKPFMVCQRVKLLPQWFLVVGTLKIVYFDEYLLLAWIEGFLSFLTLYRHANAECLAKQKLIFCSCVKHSEDAFTRWHHWLEKPGKKKTGAFQDNGKMDKKHRSPNKLGNLEPLYN